MRPRAQRIGNGTSGIPAEEDLPRIAQGGQSIDQAMAWAEGELRNFARG